MKDLFEIAQLVTEAARRGEIDQLIHYLTVCPIVISSNLGRDAAANGHFHCVKYLHGKGCPFIITICNTAAEGGSIECLQYLHEQGYALNEGMCSSALAGGSVDCLRYVLGKGCTWDPSVCELALSTKRWTTGNSLCLKHLVEKGYPAERICSDAVYAYNLEALVAAHECGYPSALAGICAAESDDVECLRYAHEHGMELCSLLVDTAAYNNSKNCLAYCLKHATLSNRDWEDIDKQLAANQGDDAYYC